MATLDTNSPSSPTLEELEDKLGEVDLDENQASDSEDFIDDVALKDAEVDLTDEESEKRKTEAISYKEEGNALFKTEDYTQARAKYTIALRTCPLAFPQERAIFYANRAACSKKEGRIKEAIKDCTSALDLNSNYVKALKRRAEMYEDDDKLDESLEDFKKILEMNPKDGDAIQAVQRLPGKINERNEKLKEQMLGTLKELGNKILRPFGLSTNNFQMQQDPNSGGYTINFNQNKT